MSTPRGYTCASCGKRHEELALCFLSREPAIVTAMPAAERAKRAELSSDQCVVDGEHFFILGNLDIPIVGHQEVLRFTVWSSLSEKNFVRSCELWETQGRELEPPYFGWLSSVVPFYPLTLNLPLSVQTSAVGVRPRLYLTDEAHALARDQAHGISWERAEEISAVAMGGAVRPESTRP